MTTLYQDQYNPEITTVYYQDQYNTIQLVHIVDQPVLFITFEIDNVIYKRVLNLHQDFEEPLSPYINDHLIDDQY
jgi:hypothetical protein